jgi:hypothetical protein
LIFFFPSCAVCYHGAKISIKIGGEFYIENVAIKRAPLYTPPLTFGFFSLLFISDNSRYIHSH